MKTETLYVPINATTEAKVVVSIREDGLGPLDAATEKAPSSSQLETVCKLILKRSYMFTSHLD